MTSTSILDRGSIDAIVFDVVGTLVDDVGTLRAAAAAILGPVIGDDRRAGLDGSWGAGGSHRRARAGRPSHYLTECRFQPGILV